MSFTINIKLFHFIAQFNFWCEIYLFFFIILPIYIIDLLLFVLVLQTQHERHENTNLRNENEKLRADNMRYREALSNASCPNCGGPTAIGEMSFDEHHLRLENARLREEVRKFRI